MSWALSYTSSYSVTSASCTLLVILLLLLGLSSQSCNGLVTLGRGRADGFPGKGRVEYHAVIPRRDGLGRHFPASNHRFPETVKPNLGAVGLPENYAAIPHRDHTIQGRHFAASNNQLPRTFANGNNRRTFPSLQLRSFSVCLEPDHEHWRINYGDGGSLDQKETPFTIMQPPPYYRITVRLTQITVGSSSFKGKLRAAFDSSTPLTILRAPDYTSITKSFASQVKGSWSSWQWGSFYLEYCYDSSHLNFSKISLTLEGGVKYLVNDPILPMVTTQGRYLYCLGISKGGDSIIGQSFMTGYRLVFSKTAVTWQASDCGNSSSQSPPTLVDNSNSPPQSPLVPNGNSNSPPESPPAPNPNSNSPPQSPPALNPNSNSPESPPLQSPPAPNHNSNSPPESPPPQSPLSPNSPPESPLASNHNSNSPPESPPAPNHNSNSPPESPPAPNRNSNSPPESSPAPNHNSNSLPTTPSQSLSFSPPLALAAESPGNDYHVPTTPPSMINLSPELKSFTCGLMMLLVSFFAIV